MDKRRKELIIALERIIGNEFYNAKIQNYGPGGVFEGEGRDYRYNISFRGKDGWSKTKFVDPAIPDAEFMTGTYKFGQNECAVIRALDEILTYLERNHGLDVKKLAR
jgi:hypothetical protein